MMTDAEILTELTEIAREIFKCDPMDKSRKQNVILARNAICYAARFRYKMTLKEIGKHFGKNHATIINSVNKHDIDYKYVNNYRRDFDKFKIKLLGIKNKNKNGEVINTSAYTASSKILWVQSSSNR